MSTTYTLTTGEEIPLGDDLLAEARELKRLHPGTFMGLSVEQIAVTTFLARRHNQREAT
jgi:hypothetical protein